MRYIYLLKNPEDNKIVYVGETVNIKHRFIKHKCGSIYDSEDKKEWLKYLKSKDLNPIIEIIDFADNKQDALIKENFYISKYLKEGYKLFNININNYTSNINNYFININNYISNINNYICFVNNYSITIINYNSDDKNIYFNTI